MSTIGPTLTSLNTFNINTTQSTVSQTSILADKSNTLAAKSTLSTLNPKGRLDSAGMMNVRTERAKESRNIAHQSMYELALQRNWLPPELPNPPQDVVLNGRGHIETKMNYAEINGWLNDIPVMYTMMMADRTYQDTKLVFSNRTRRVDNTTTNSWIM